MKYWDKSINGFRGENTSGNLIAYEDDYVNTLFEQAEQNNSVIIADSITGLPALQGMEIDTQTLYEERVVELIRQKYTLSQELAILRQQTTKPEEYQEYFTYCEQCKAQAKIQYNIN